MALPLPLRVTRRDRQFDRTHARLFEAALAEFRRVGFDRASVARIARRARVSRPSFYFHFPAKEDVLLELQWRLEQRIVGSLRPEAAFDTFLNELVEGFIQAEETVGDSALFRDMLGIYVRRPPALDDQPLPVLHAVTERFAEAARKGELRAGLEPARATHLFLTGVFGYLIGTPGPAASRREDLETLVLLYVEGPSR